jgi:hypothetical protein
MPASVIGTLVGSLGGFCHAIVFGFLLLITGL